MTFRSRLLLSLVAALLLLATLFIGGGVSPLAAARAVVALPVGVYCAALGLHVVTYSLRALRFRALLPRAVRPGFRRLLTVTAAHNMASYVLPLKTGEASLVVYLKLQGGTPASAALAALLVSRFLDGAALCSGMAAACLVLRDEGRALQWLGPASALLVALTLLFGLLSVRGDLLVRAIERALGWLRVHHWRLGQSLLERTNTLALALRAASGRKGLGAAALATVPMWCTVFGFFALLGRALGLPPELSFLERAFGASFAAIFNLLPVNAAAGVGTQELGWVTGFHLIGVDEKVALTAGVGVHLVQLFNIVAMGLVAHLAMGVTPRLRFPDELD
jgi:hypothetical protein